MIVVSPTTRPYRVDEEVFADLRAGVDVDTGLRVRVFRHHARDHRDLVLIQLVCDAVDEDGEHAGYESRTSSLL